MDRNNIEKIAQAPEDKILLAKVWDKITAGMRKNIPASTCFLTLRELEMTRYLFGQQPGLYAFGGYADAERQMLVYLPEYLDESTLTAADAPVVCLQATFYEDVFATHRDFLGALMGAGIAREAVGDICVGTGNCCFFVTAEIAPYLLQNFTSVGRIKLHLEQLPLGNVQVPAQKTVRFRDAVPSLRLDNVICAGFRISRNTAAQSVLAGKAAIDGLPCEKPDKLVEPGAKISLRGYGKVKLTALDGTTKKGRIAVIFDRYV